MSNNRSASIQLERAMTHLLISDNDRLRLFGPLLDKRMFLEAVNYRFINTALELLTEGNLTKLNLLESIESGGTDNAETIYIQQLSAVTGTSSFDKHYASWIEHARLRFIDNANATLETGELSSSDLIAARIDVLDKARALGLPDSGISTENALLEQLNWIDYLRSVDGKGILSTGYAEFDRNIIGLVPGTFSVIAARPSHGKTTLAAQLALMAQEASDRPVLFNTLEVPPPKLAFKLAAFANKENPIRYDRAYALASIEYEAMKARILKQSPLNIRYTGIHDPWAFESSIIATKPSLVIWDFLQLMTTPKRFSGRRGEFIGEAARLFQKIAVRNKIPFVALAQLNRDGDGGSANLTNLKDSGGIEEAADNIFFLQRPHFDQPGVDRYKAIYSNEKARNGFVGASVELMLNPKTGAFERWNPTVIAQIVKDLNI